MGKLYKRGNTWYGEYRDVFNRRVKVTLKTHDRVVAQARLRDRELGTTSQAPHAPKALDAAVDAMATLKKPIMAKAYREYAGHLFRLLGQTVDINSLDGAAVTAYCSSRLTEGASRHTISKELSCLRQTLKDAKRRGEFVGALDIVPAWTSDYEPETRWLTPLEFGKLLQAAPEKRRTWLMLQAYTGAEMGVMKRFAASPRGGWEFVDLKHGKITLPGTKKSTRFRAGIPLHPELKTWLKKLDDANDAKPLVERWTKVNRDIKWACKRAGIDNISTHDLRRTFGSWLVQNGVDLHHVARLLGNTAAMVSKVYGQTSDASYAAAINTLPRLKRPRRQRKA